MCQGGKSSKKINKNLFLFVLITFQHCSVIKKHVLDKNFLRARCSYYDQKRGLKVDIFQKIKLTDAAPLETGPDQLYYLLQKKRCDV